MLVVRGIGTATQVHASTQRAIATVIHFPTSCSTNGDEAATIRPSDDGGVAAYPAAILAKVTTMDSGSP